MYRLHLLPLLALICLAIPCAAGTVAVRGTVVDSSGARTAGARVRAILEYRGMDQASVERTANANADGSFAFADLNIPKPSRPELPWRYYFAADMPDGSAGWVVHDPKRHADDTYSITLARPSSSEGRIVDRGGAPVSGATVRAIDLYTKDHGLDLTPPALDLVAPPRPATTDANGRYRLQGVPDGMFAIVRAEKNGLAMASSGSPGETVVMIPGGSISGRVVDRRGRPVAGATVDAQASRTQPGDLPGVLYQRGFYAGWGKATTGADGSYVVKGLNTLRFDLSLAGPADLLARTLHRIDVKAGPTTKAPDLIASAGVLITGRVVDADTRKPVADARLRFEGSARPAVVEADALGAYKARVLPERVHVQYTGGNAEYMPVWDDGPLGTVVPPIGIRGLDIPIKHAEQATGKVVDEEGKPLPGMAVDLFGHSLFSWGSTDSEGIFRIWIVPPMPGSKPLKPGAGEIQVRIKSQDRTLGAVEFVQRSDLAGMRTYTVRAPFRLSVIVKGPDGQPMKGASANVGGPAGMGYQATPGTTDESGRLHFNVYAGDRPSVWAFSKGYHQKGSVLKLPAVGSADWKDTVEVDMVEGTPHVTNLVGSTLRR